LRGARVALGGPDAFPADGPFLMRRLPFADHSFRVPASAPLTQREALDQIVATAGRWLREFGSGV